MNLFLWLPGQFDTVDFSNNEIRKLDNFPQMLRLTNLLFSNNGMSKIAKNIMEQVPNLKILKNYVLLVLALFVYEAL